MSQVPDPTSVETPGNKKAGGSELLTGTPSGLQCSLDPHLTWSTTYFQRAHSSHSGSECLSLLVRPTPTSGLVCTRRERVGGLRVRWSSGEETLSKEVSSVTRRVTLRPQGRRRVRNPRAEGPYPLRKGISLWIFSPSTPGTPWVNDRQHSGSCTPWVKPFVSGP